jgi:putative flippase GtrA
VTPVSLAGLPGRRVLAQFTRYGIAGGAAVGVHLAVLVVLVEVVGSPAVIASVVGFACGTMVNYALQYRFVFARFSGHRLYFPRYVSVTLATMALNTALFWALSSGLGLFYLASQVITIAIVVPVNFAINRSFTFAP